MVDSIPNVTLGWFRVTRGLDSFCISWFCDCFMPSFFSFLVRLKFCFLCNKQPTNLLSEKTFLKLKKKKRKRKKKNNGNWNKTCPKSGQTEEEGKKAHLICCPWQFICFEVVHHPDRTADRVDGKEVVCRVDSFCHVSEVTLQVQVNT